MSVFYHTMLAIKQGVKADATPEELFAILCHDFGKAICWNERGNLHGHEEAGVEYVEVFCDRLKVPKSYRNLAVKVCENHQRSHRAKVLKPKSVHNLLKSLDCFRNPDILSSFNLCNWADATGRTGFENRVYDQGAYLTECLEATKSVSVKEIQHNSKKELSGKELGDRIRIEQINAIRGVKNKWKTKS